MYLKNHINLPINLKHRLRFESLEIEVSISFFVGDFSWPKYWKRLDKRPLS